MFSNLHLFLLRYKWYNKLIQNEFAISYAIIIVALSFILTIFLLKESALKSAVHIVISLLLALLTFMRLQQPGSKRFQRINIFIIYLCIVEAGIMTTKLLTQI